MVINTESQNRVETQKKIEKEAIVGIEGGSCGSSFSFFFFFKILFILFLEKGEGREKERERDISVWLPLTCPQLRT